MPQTTDKVEPIAAVIGIDIAKDTMVLHDSISLQTWTIANTYAAALQALKPFAGHDLAVCEATGGHERALLEAACALGLPVHRADPAKAKAVRATALLYVRQRTPDLLTQMAVRVQGYLALDLVKQNNVELVKGVDRASTTTVGALRKASEGHDVSIQALSHHKEGERGGGAGHFDALKAATRGNS